jgi:hypothetical protein
MQKAGDVGSDEYAKWEWSVGVEFAWSDGIFQASDLQKDEGAGARG